MAKKITKMFYKSAKRVSKDPIDLMHKMYNIHCDTKFRIPSPKLFEDYFGKWLKKKGFTLLQGCLLIQKEFDSKFA